MYQVKNGDYAQTIALLDALALQKFREESAASLAEHNAHAQTTPASYTMLTKHGVRVADDEKSRKAVAEDEARFKALRERSLNTENVNLHSKNLSKNSNTSIVSTNHQKTGKLSKIFSAFAIVFAVICLITSLPNFYDEIDPMLIVFAVIATAIVGIGLSGKKRRR